MSSTDVFLFSTTEMFVWTEFHLAFMSAFLFHVVSSILLRVRWNQNHPEHGIAFNLYKSYGFNSPPRKEIEGIKSCLAKTKTKLNGSKGNKTFPKWELMPCTHWYMCLRRVSSSTHVISNYDHFTRIILIQYIDIMNSEYLAKF